MSKHAGKSRTEIGERLVARVECARARYESLRSEAKALRELADACLGNSDGEIQRYASANRRVCEAIAAYQRAIRDLNDFVLRGKMPTDLE